MSYVNPNARCPVCGSSVFFYKSPDGGSVYFDELGSPWPKHPCTDNGRFNNIRPTPPDSIANHHRLIWPNGWKPLIYSNCLPDYGSELITIYQGRSLLDRILKAPTGTSKLPCFWRTTDDEGIAEISCPNLDGNGSEKIIKIPTWESYADLDKVYRLAWSASFDLKTENPNWSSHEDVNLALAVRYFKYLEQKNYWRASNNLGVMYRDGIGVAPDAKLAFTLFDKAVKLSCGDITPLRHLIAMCYDEDQYFDFSERFQR